MLHRKKGFIRQKYIGWTFERNNFMILHFPLYSSEFCFTTYLRDCRDICTRCCKLGMSSSFAGKTNIKMQALKFAMGHQFVTVAGRVLHWTITATGNTMLKHNRTKIKWTNGLLICAAPKRTMACRNNSGIIFYICRKPHQPCVLILV